MRRSSQRTASSRKGAPLAQDSPYARCRRRAGGRTGERGSHRDRRVFTLDLSAATVSAAGRQVKVGNIDVRLTATAAGALNQALGTHLFIGGLDIGTARTTLRV